MPFDYKKEYKELYLPKNLPQIVEVPQMNYAAIRGKGDPNSEESGYKAAIEVLYAISYTLKMSYKGPHTINGFFEYVVPPLEGFWYMEGTDGVDYLRAVQCAGQNADSQGSCGHRRIFHVSA